MTHRRRDIVALCFTLAAVGASLVVALSLRTGADGSDSMENGPVAGRKTESGAPGSVHPRIAARETGARTGGGSGFGQEPRQSSGGDPFRLEDLYAPAELRSDGTFEPQTPEPAFGDSCARYDGSLRGTGLGPHLGDLGFSARWMTPEDVHVVDWNRHLRQGDSYVQVSVTWNHDLPPTYAASASRGDSPVALDHPLPVFDDTRPSDSLDVADALAAAQALVARLEDAGAVSGARTMVVSDRAFDPGRITLDAPKRVEFRNGALVAYEDPEVFCGEGESGFACECPLR